MFNRKRHGNLALLQPDSEFDRSSIEGLIKHLGEISLFSDIRENYAALENLAKILEEHTYKPNTAIIEEGKSGTEMFFLIQGQASVFKTTADGEPYMVAILNGSEHAFFGEGGLIGLDSRSATIQADTQCYCLVLSQTAFQNFCTQCPQWALPILLQISRVVMNRLRKTNQDLILLYTALVNEIRGGS